MASIPCSRWCRVRSTSSSIASYANCSGLASFGINTRARPCGKIDAPLADSQALTGVARTSDNERMVERARKRLRKRAKRGLSGYPVATIALYGPGDIRATKLTVGIVPAEDAGVADLRRWFSKGTDIATMGALQKKCSRSSTRPEPNP
jgi:hypothetical protein